MQTPSCNTCCHTPLLYNLNWAGILIGMAIPPSPFLFPRGRVRRGGIAKVTNRLQAIIHQENAYIFIQWRDKTFLLQVNVNQGENICLHTYVHVNVYVVHVHVCVWLCSTLALTPLTINAKFQCTCTGSRKGTAF